MDERDEGSFRFSLVNHAAAQFQIGVVIILILMCIAVSFLYQLALLHRMGILYTFQLNQHRKYAVRLCIVAVSVFGIHSTVAKLKIYLVVVFQNLVNMHLMPFLHIWFTMYRLSL